MIDCEITADKWTVIAKRTGSYWQWCDERDKTAKAQKSLHALSDANHIIIMHRRVGRDWELVARLSGPVWRCFQARRP